MLLMCIYVPVGVMLEDPISLPLLPVVDLCLEQLLCHALLHLPIHRSLCVYMCVYMYRRQKCNVREDMRLHAVGKVKCVGLIAYGDETIPRT